MWELFMVDRKSVDFIGRATGKVIETDTGPGKDLKAGYHLPARWRKPQPPDAGFT